MSANTLIIDIEYNTEDEEYGGVYIATQNQIGLVTYGKTFEELLYHLKEAVAVCLEGVDTLAKYGIAPDVAIELKSRPSIL
jgi:hypothetical protein